MPDNYNYPLGADADPRAPWHASEYPEPDLHELEDFVFTHEELDLIWFDEDDLRYYVRVGKEPRLPIDMCFRKGWEDCAIYPDQDSALSRLLFEREDDIAELWIENLKEGYEGA